MTGVLLLGLLRREEHGITNIGFESSAIAPPYLAALPLLAASG